VYFLNTDFIRTQLYEFGKHMHAAAIALVLCFIVPIAPITGIIALVFIFLGIGDLKRLNFQLNNPNLELVRSKYVSSFVMRIVAIILFVAGGTFLGVGISIFMHYMYFFNLFNILLGAICLIVGFILSITSAVDEMKAWENLKIFFQQNKELVPDVLRHEVIDGCDNLRTGALLYALGFLVITAFIGFIFQIVGYFKLAKLTTIIYQQPPKEETSQYQVQYQEPVVQHSQPAIPKEQETEKPIETINFCPNCGAKLSRGGRFCPLCGSKVND
jgi:uncharacterized membrane protein